MSKFDKYKEPLRVSKFDKYKEPLMVTSEIQEGDDIAGSLIPKAIASGVLSIADLPQTVYGLGKSAANYVSDKLFGTDSAAVEQMNNAVLPQMPMISDVIKKGVNNITWSS